MNMEQAIRAVIGPEAPEDRILAVARHLIDQGETEPMPAAITAADEAVEAGGVCQWFTNCDRTATHTEPHPILGSVPTCDPCGKWIAEQSAAERN